MIEKGWAAYREEKELDLYGKGLAPKSTHLAAWGHPQEFHSPTAGNVDTCVVILLGQVLKR